MNTETRQYRSFPYVNVLKTLAKTRSYLDTAKQHGYYLEGAEDPIKPLRAHLHRARHVGFMYNGKRVKFPKMDREGNFVGKISPTVKEIIGDVKTIPSTKRKRTEKKSSGNEQLFNAFLNFIQKKGVETKVAPKPVAKAVASQPVETDVKFREVGKVRGPMPKKAVVFLMENGTKFVTLKVPQVTNILPVDKLLSILENIQEQVAQQNTENQVVEEQQDAEQTAQPEAESKIEDVLSEVA